MKYRKKPVEVDAEQWHAFGDHIKVDVWRPDESQQYNAVKDQVNSSCGHCGDSMPSHGRVRTPKGYHIVCPGDWIIEGESEKHGKHYWAVNDDYFKKAYEPAE